MRILLVIYDNGSYISTFPQGSAYIARALLDAGHEVVVYNQDLNHWPDSHLTEYLNTHDRFDIVGIGVIGGYWQYRKLLGLSKAVNASNNKPDLFVIGGHGPSPAPGYFLKKTGADVVVHGEAEQTMVELAELVRINSEYRDDKYIKLRLRDISGISYLEDGQCVTTGRREPLNVDSILWPAYHLFPIEYYRLFRVPNASRTDFVMPVASARGCIFRCNFCYRMVPGYRPRDPDDVCSEIAHLNKNYGVNYVDFSDELLMSSEQRIDEMCEAIERFQKYKYPGKFKWRCNGRLNFAAPRSLKRMKDCGCVFINYGIESFDDAALERMNKHLTTDQITRGVEATLAAGISPGLNIIFGNIGETAETLQKGVDFLLKYADSSQFRTIRPVTPYPGSELFDCAVELGLLGGIEDFYERKHVNSDLLTVNFTDMTDDEFYSQLALANRILTRNYYEEVEDSVMKQIDQLYLCKDTSFRGFRQT